MKHNCQKIISQNFFQISLKNQQVSRVSENLLRTFTFGAIFSNQLLANFATTFKINLWLIFIKFCLIRIAIVDLGGIPIWALKRPLKAQRAPKKAYVMFA